MPLDQPAVSVPVDRTSSIPLPPNGGSAVGQESTGTPTSAECVTPLIDIYEGTDGLVLEADLPGVSEENLSIQLEDNVLNLRGRVNSALPAGSRALHEEYSPGDFGRSFILSDEVDRARVTATLKNGVLRITLPKAERARTRKIEIKLS